MTTLLAAAFLGGCALGVFLTLVAGIRIEERRAAGAHRGAHAEFAARQVMGVYVRKSADAHDAHEAGR